MERIKQALVKARQNGNFGRQSVSLRIEMPVAVLEYEYTHTRTFQLDPYLMNRNRIVAFSKDDPHSGVFDVLRTKVLKKMDEKGWNTLAITSPISTSGKTTIAINLAIAMARRIDRTVLLVDFDLRQPNVAKLLDIPVGASLNQILNGCSDIFETLVNPGIPRLVILPAIPSEFGSAELLSSPMLKSLVSELRHRYPDRIIIFDTPAILGTDDTMAVLPQIDCALLVVGDGETTEPQINLALSNMSGINLVGTVLNKAQTTLQN